MVINQLKAQLHIWMDHTPGDLARPKGLASVTALLDAASLGAHVCQVLTDMITEIAELNRRVCDLDGTIAERVAPLAPTLLEIIGISYISAAILSGPTTAMED